MSPRTPDKSSLADQIRYIAATYTHSEWAKKKLEIIANKVERLESASKKEDAGT